MTPAINSYEYAAEHLVIVKLQSYAPFQGKDIRHHEFNQAATRDAIVVKGEKDEKFLDGPQGYNVTVSVMFVSDILSADEADQIAKNISERVYQDDPSFNLWVQTEMPDLLGAWLEPGTSTVRDDRKKLRKRTIKFPFIIVLSP